MSESNGTAVIERIQSRDDTPSRRWQPREKQIRDNGYRLGKFFQLVAGAQTVDRQRHEGAIRKEFGPEYAVYKTAMAEDSGVVGGYLVPPELSYELMDTVEEFAFFRRLAHVVPMKTRTLDLSIPDITTAYAAGVSPFLAGIKMQWGGFITLTPETEPQWRQVELCAWPLTGLCYASNTLLADAPALDGWVRNEFARAVAWYEDYACFQGVGSGQPLGVINCQAAMQVTRAGGAGSSTVALADIGNMSNSLMPSSWERACWVVHPSTWLKLIQIGGTGSPSFQINQPMSEAGWRDGIRPYGVMNGLPMYVSEKVATLGSTGDVVLMDPYMYLLGHRYDLLLDFSRYEPTSYAKNQGVFRIWHRGDGQPKISGPVTLQDAKTQVSPFVLLH
jgi:HK97 family phage major capsid protein